MHLYEEVPILSADMQGEPQAPEISKSWSIEYCQEF